MIIYWSDQQASHNKYLIARIIIQFKIKIQLKEFSIKYHFNYQKFLSLAAMAETLSCCRKKVFMKWMLSLL